MVDEFGAKTIISGSAGFTRCPGIVYAEPFGSTMETK